MTLTDTSIIRAKVADTSYRIEDEPEHAYYWFLAPTHQATLETLVRVAGQRWQIEQSFRQPQASAVWTTMKCATGRDGIATSRWPCWPTQPWPSCERGEKKTPEEQVPLSVSELRHLLTHLLWRGWHGAEHLLHWSSWRRKHQCKAHLPL